jgi:hypothetical protein
MSKKNPPTQKSPQPKAAAARPETALDRMQPYIQSNLDYKPITLERAVELTDKIVAYDDDEQVYAFIELLYGICAAHFTKGAVGRPDVESLVMEAAQKAYSRTVHFNAALHEFAWLDLSKPDDLRVVTRQFGESEGEQ